MDEATVRSMLKALGAQIGDLVVFGMLVIIIIVGSVDTNTR
jgi:hypothetical protein